MRKLIVFCLSAAPVAVLLVAAVPPAPFPAGTVVAAEAGDAPPTVIELFTSQGCSSCPPADQILYELARRDDVVAISWHVSYWDYIGWKDPFATDWSTARQRAYRGRFERNYVYTPQMVIDGQHDVIGSRRGTVTRTVADSRAEAAARIRIGLDRDSASDELVIALPPQRLDRALEIWLVGYSGAHETRVLRGENQGATLRNTHVARILNHLGRWNGAAKTLRVPLPLHEDVAGFAVLLQEPGQGAIRGAAKLDLTS